VAYAALCGIDNPKPWWLSSDGVITTPLIVYGTFARPLFGASLAYMIYLCASGSAPRLAWVLGWPVWRPIARLSYSMYLLQAVSGADLLAPARDAILTAFGNDSVPLLVLAMYMWVALYNLGSVPLAFLSYMLVERPGMRLGQYLLQLRCCSLGSPATQKQDCRDDSEANPRDLEANDVNDDMEEASTSADVSVLESSLPEDCDGPVTSDVDASLEGGRSK